MDKIKQNPMYGYLLFLAFAVALGFQAWRTLLNNYAVEEIGINGAQIGIIQSIREVPGFLSLLVIYIVMVVKEHRLSAISVLLLGVGVAVTGMLPSFEGLILATILMSVGFHYYETTNQSLTLQYFNKRQAPLVFGKIRSYTALANILIGAIIWTLSTYLEYRITFLVIGSAVFLMGCAALFIDPTRMETEPQHKKVIFKKKYWLFYVLNFLSGARRQIFVVFSLFMLVQKYNYSVKMITILFVINNIVAYFINPIIARSINKFGEKKVLTVEYISLVFVFMSYVIFEDPIIAGVLYVLDHLFFPFSIGIKTYFQKHADPRDIGSSMAVGFTINHISAVVIPVLGGFLWMVDWRIPFVLGALLSLVSLGFVQKMKPDPELESCDNNSNNR